MSELLTHIQIETPDDAATMRAFTDDLLRGHQARIAVAQERQARVAKLRQDVDAWSEEMEPVMRVDPVIYWGMIAMHGPECWSDNGFRKDMMKHKALENLK